MRNGTVAIYDSDINYLHHLSEYLRLREDFPYDILVFSSLDAFNKSTLDSIDIFITSYIPEFINTKDIGDVFFLTTESADTIDGFPCLCKYEPADTLLRKIMNKSTSICGTPFITNDKQCFIIGVYSPVGRCGKTSLSLSLGCALSKTSPTLLISFDSFSLLPSFIEGERMRDISDLLFYFKEEPDNLKNKLLSLTYDIFQLKFLCPALSPLRIKTTEEKMWCQLIKEIARTWLYKYIVVDISDCFSSQEEFFKLSDIIYMPILNDYVSVCKVNNFMDFLSHGTGVDKDKFKSLTLPEMNNILTDTAYNNWIFSGTLFTYSSELAKEVFYE